MRVGNLPGENDSCAVNTTAESTAARSFLGVLLVGIAAGVLAAVAMLVTMGILRLAFGWPTPTELIFDRLFPLLTVEFFIGSLVKAGGDLSSVNARTT